MLVDSHCHLDFDVFEADRDSTVQRALDGGVGLMVTICTRLTRFAAVHALAGRYPAVFCSVGIHPHQVEEEGVAPEDRLVALAAQDKVVGIGECGLDYYYDKSPRDAQQANFRNHIAAARRTGLPVIIHSRDADDDTAAILRQEAARGAFSGVMHCFSSGPGLARAALDLGLFISISGIVTFKNSEELRSIVRDVPIDRLLVETDAPFLAPAPLRGKRNEPAFVVHTAARVAEIKGIERDALASATTENFFKLFQKAKYPAAT